MITEVLSDDVVLVRRTKGGNLCRTYDKPVLKIEINGGRFILSQPTADLLKVDDGGGDNVWIQ